MASVTQSTQKQPPATPQEGQEELIDLDQIDPDLLRTAMQRLSEVGSEQPTQVTAPNKETSNAQRDERVKKACCNIL